MGIAWLLFLPVDETHINAYHYKLDLFESSKLRHFRTVMNSDILHNLVVNFLYLKVQKTIITPSAQHF